MHRADHTHPDWDGHQEMETAFLLEGISRPVTERSQKAPSSLSHIPYHARWEEAQAEAGKTP